MSAPATPAAIANLVNLVVIGLLHSCRPEEPGLRLMEAFLKVRV
jgi:hypothetical protein